MTDEHPDTVVVLTPVDAMTITVVVYEAFASLPIPAMAAAQRHGALLLLDTLMQRVKPLLPRTPEMEHVFDGIEKARAVAALVRDLNGFPSTQ